MFWQSVLPTAHELPEGKPLCMNGLPANPVYTRTRVLSGPVNDPAGSTNICRTNSPAGIFNWYILAYTEFMLNRRILRIKVMQTLYAYKQAEGADYQLALDQIDEAFAPDLNAPEPPDLNRLEGSRQLSRVLFEEHYLASHLPPDEDASVEVRKAVNNALVFFHTQRKKDAQQLQKQMVAETEKIFDRYLLVLLLHQTEPEQSNWHAAR
jgi:hypothetical protein